MQIQLNRKDNSSKIDEKCTQLIEIYDYLEYEFGEAELEI